MNEDKSKWLLYPAEGDTDEDEGLTRREIMNMLAEELAVTEQSEIAKVRDAFNGAINFVLDEAGAEGAVFLNSWREGDWETIATEWPEYKIPEELK